MKFKIPHTFVLLFSIIVLAALFTWVIPAGEFERVTKEVNGTSRNIIIADSYHKVEANGQSWEIFSAFYEGFVHKADIIVFIFIVGGAFMVVNRSKAITVGIQSVLKMILSWNHISIIKKIGAEQIIIAVVMLVFSIFGAIFGMSEETIPFVLILVPLAISMGYDSLVGVSMCFVAAGLGFAGAILNPFTIGVAQGVAEIQLFSGIEYRTFCFFIINLVGISFVLHYANKIKKDPSKSFVHEEDKYWRNEEEKNQDIKNIPAETSTFIAFGIISISLILFSIFYNSASISIASIPLTAPYIPILAIITIISSFIALRKGKQLFILSLVFNSILYIIIGVMAYEWYIEEIATLFFALGIFSGIAMGFSGDEIVEGFMDGIKDIAGAAIVVAVAGGIVEILQHGKIIDTILFGISDSIKDLPSVLSVNVMYFIQTVLNIFIPSGSGQAALTMPIMAPLADLIGISRQSAVMAFQFGDGFTNLITPTSGVLIGCLGMAKIPFEKWLKWMMKLQIWLLVTAIALLIPTVLIPLNGF